jgi:uncharacterized protein YggE
MRILAPALAALLLFPTLYAPALADEGARITVTGEGSVNARPDMATVNLGVTTEGPTAKDAMAANTAQLATVLDKLRASGIEDRDIQTSGLSLNPNWQQVDGQMTPTIVGFIASNMLTVRVRALDNLGAVLDAAVTDGANSFNGLSFGLADPAPSMNEARKLAVADATARAQLLSEAAGMRLGPVVAISEGGGMGAPMPMFRMEASAGDAVPIAAGEIASMASVTMVFELTK